MTNAKLQTFLSSNPQQPLNNRYLKLISLPEIQAFVGLMILSGVFHADRESVEDLYSDDLNFGKPLFRATMPRERFKTILRFLRFDHHTTRGERIKVDRLAPIRDIFEMVNKSFSAAYNPGKYITIDEHLCRYRGRCGFLQYMPKKPDKYGLKIWILADARTFYPINLEIYSGANLYLSNKPEDITLRLVTKLNPGHIIVGDNYFTSLKLSKRLFHEKSLFYFGTIKKLRREIPRNVVQKIRISSLYSSNFYYNENNTLVSYNCSKKTTVLLLSNVHRDPNIPSTDHKLKPQIILDYNRNKSGVDKLDQMNKEYRPYRATRRWPCVIFYDLIALSTLASWVLFCLKYPEDNIVKTRNRKQFLYLLGIELVTPLVNLRKNAPNFRYLPVDIKSTIGAVCNGDYHKEKRKKTGKIAHQAVNFHQPQLPIITDSPQTQLVSVLPLPQVVTDLPEVHLDSVLTLPQVVTDRPGAPFDFLRPQPYVVESDLSYSDEVVISESISAKEANIIDNQVALSLTSKPSKTQPRVGRCKFCKRNEDKKTRKRCELCLAFVCVPHSRTLYLCTDCEENNSFI